MQLKYEAYILDNEQKIQTINQSNTGARCENLEMCSQPNKFE